MNVVDVRQECAVQGQGERGGRGCLVIANCFTSATAHR